MKRFIKVFAGLAVLGTLSLSTTINDHLKAASDGDASYQYIGEQGVNPDYQTMNRLLTEAALKYDVPPEIVKAVAEKESGDWRQFDENGEAIVTSDNGIGIMQVTNQSGYKEELLKSDIVYNIEAGVQILDEMFYKRNDLPSINGKKRDVLEHWYFAIMAYNGIKPVNSPIVQADDSRNLGAYQEKVYSYLGEYGGIKVTSLPFTSKDFQYDPDRTNNIEFVTKDYHFNVPFTKSKHYFTAGQEVETTTDVRLRSSATTGDNNVIVKLNAGEVLTITGPFRYDEDPTKKNHFVWYPVKRSDGTTGFVASSYLTLQFHDVPVSHYAEDEIDYLVDRGILYGVGDDNFGIGQPLTRWQAVLLITRANNVSLDNRPDPGFTDVPEDHPQYKEIAAAVDEGLFKGVSDNSFEPDATLTRNQMAVILQRLYQFPSAATQHPFTDLTAEWYADEVARLYHAGITDGVDETKTKFGPEMTVTREQFAVFMVRSMEWMKRTE